MLSDFREFDEVWFLTPRTSLRHTFINLNLHYHTVLTYRLFISFPYIVFLNRFVFTNSSKLWNSLCAAIMEKWCAVELRSAKQRNDLQWLIPIRPDACLRLKFLHLQDRISLFNWLIFLMKRASHFSTELNSRDIQKCNCFWVPSYDLDPPTKNSGICPWP